MKTETCKLYSRDCWIFLPNIVKIDHYNSELYRLKVGAFFFETQCTAISIISRLHPSIINNICYNSGAVHVLSDLCCDSNSFTCSHAMFQVSMWCNSDWSVQNSRGPVLVHILYSIPSTFLCARNSNDERSKKQWPDLIISPDPFHSVIFPSVYYHYHYYSSILTKTRQKKTCCDVSRHWLWDADNSDFTRDSAVSSSQTYRSTDPQIQSINPIH